MKEYTNGEITICWEPSKCLHSQNCVKGLPSVFDRDKKPWINMRGASSEEIVEVVSRCPSGALTYKMAESVQEPAAQIKVTKDGPLIIQGNCALMGSDGRELERCGPFALCRCGGSKNKPYCDGTHKVMGFEDDLMPIE